MMTGVQAGLMTFPDVPFGPSPGWCRAPIVGATTTPHGRALHMSGYRQTALGIGGVAVLLLIWLTNPWFKVEGDLRGIVTIAFWILAIALVVVLYLDRRETGPQEVSVSGPA